MDDAEYEFDAAKSLQLRKERGLGFEEIIALIEQKGIVASMPHPDQEKYPGQKIWYVDVDGYLWAVIHMQQAARVRLITMFPSRKATGKWHKEKSDAG